MAGYNMPKPWCYVNGVKKPCAVDKCQRDCGDPTSGVWGRFQAKNTGMCWDIEGSGGSSRPTGANLQMNNCELPHDDNNDHVFKMDSQGYLINQRSGMCVNLWGDRDTDNRVNYNMWICQHSSTNTDQKFTLDWHPSDSCAFRLRNKATNKCIDADGNGDTDRGTNLQQYTCRDSDSDDHWYYFLPVSDRVCTYEHRSNAQSRGSDVLNMGPYNTLFAAQSACSRVGDKCGGVYHDPPYASKFYLRSEKTTWQQTNYEAWVKMDCDDAKFEYFEQKFKD